MALPPNIERFNRTTLLLLGRLYEAFPVPVEISSSKLAMDVLPKDASYEESSSASEPTYHAIEFLATEGFITHGGSAFDGEFAEVRLTAKALAILGATPSSLEQQTNIYERIRNLLKGGIREAGSEATKKLVEVVFEQGPALAALASALPKP